MDRVFRVIAYRPRTVLAGIALFTLFLASQLWDFGAREPRLRVETAVNRILPEGDEARRIYARFRETFGNDELILVALVDDDIFTAENLRRIERITQRLQRVEGIRRVVSLSNTPEIRSVAGDVVIETVFHEIPEDESALAEMRRRVLGNPVHVGNLVSRDGRVAAFFIYPLEMSEREFRERGIDKEVLRIAREEAGDEATAVLGGAPPVKAATSRLLLRDLLRQVPVQLLLMALVAFLSFRSWRGVLIPLSVIGLAELWTVGLVAGSGHTLNLVTYIVPPLILAVGFAYSVHVVAEHAEVVRERAGEAGPEAALLALQSVAFPVFLTALTTAAGFLSLATSTIPAIRGFGVFCVVGVLSALAASLFLAPAVLSLLPAPPLETRRSADATEAQLERLASRVGAFDARHARLILLAGSAVFALALAGLTRIEVSTELTHNLKSDHPIRRDMAIFNEHLDGTAQLYLMLEAERGAFKEPINVERLRDLQEWLEAQPEVRGTTSLADYLMVVNRAFHHGDPAHFAVPDSRPLISQYLFFLWKDQLENFVDPQFASASILVRAPSYATNEYAALLDRIETRLREMPEGMSAHVTGNTALVVRTIDDIAWGQAVSLSAAALIIYAILALYFRSLRVGLYALIPNVLPVVVYFGMLGLTGVTLNVITSLIACIILGIAVDDTIHFLVRFREKAGLVGDETQAAVLALRSVARPVTSTTVALAAGFSVLAVSSLKHQVEFGWLAASMLVFAWLVDVTFTPALASRIALGQANARTRGPL